MLGFFGIGTAQPSGGPYGPLAQRYDVPKTGHVFYVAPDGAAAAAGQALETPTSLESAVARAVTGDTLILRGGVYRTGSLLLSQGVTLQPYEEERPILKGTELATDWKPAANSTWQTRWTKLFPATPADWWRKDRNIAQTPLHLFNNDMLFVNGQPYAAVGRVEDVKGQTYHIDYERAMITLGTDPTQQQVEITAHDFALIRTMRDAHGKPNDGRGLILRGLTFTQYAYRALEVEGVEPGRYLPPSAFGKEIVGSQLENVTITHCSHVAGYFRGDGLTIRNCLISDTGTEGLYVINSSDVVIERNIVTRTNHAEKLTGCYAAAVKIFNQSYRTVVRDNLIIDNPDSSGVWYDVGNVDGVFVNNWVENTNDGLFFEISKGVVCAGNVFVNVNKGIRILNSSGAKVYQNTFYNSVASFERNERSAVGDHFGWHPSAGPAVTERHNHEFANNLLVADASFSGPLLRFWQADTLKGQLVEPQVRALNANVYVRRAISKPEALISWSPTKEGTGSVDFRTLADFQQANPSFETQGVAHPDFWAPVFRSADLRRLELAPTFPSARVAIALPEAVRTALSWAADQPAHTGAIAP